MPESLAELLKRLAEMGRGETFARRHPDGSYRPEHRAFTIADAEDQLAGKASFGVYLVKQDKTHLGVLDFDDHDGVLGFEMIAEQASNVCLELTTMGMKPIMFRSGGGAGVHIWVLFERPQPAKAVRETLRVAAGRCQLREGTLGVSAHTVEIFPKQDRVEEGALGNLIALPFARMSGWIDPVDLKVHTRPDRTREWSSVLSPDIPAYSTISAPLAPRRYAASTPGNLEEVKQALKFVPADDYDVWIRALIALKKTFGDEGLDVWHDWSKSSAKYRGEAQCFKLWRSAKPRGTLSIGSIFFLAKQHGWNGPEASPIRRMNERFGILTHGSKTLIIVKNGDRLPEDDVNLLGVRPFLDRLAPEKIATPGSDGETRPLAPFWMKHANAAHYHRIDFDPSMPPGHNGTKWNLWQGFPYEPLPGSWDRLQEHLFANVCGGSDEQFKWLLNWLALGLQKPASVIGTAIVMRGSPGVGKSFVAERYGALWGPHYIAITQASHVLGRFNSHLFARRLVFVDEGMFGGNRREAGIIKTRITEPFTVLERKGVDPIKTRNRALYIVASNEDSIVPADLGDRRWMVFDVSAKRKEDRSYFAEIMEEMNSGGHEAMMFDLVNRNIDNGPDPRKIIKTEALFDQILRAQPAYVQYVHNLLDQRRLPQNRVAGANNTTIRAMIEDLWRLHPSERRLTSVALGRHVRKIIPAVQTDQNGRFLVRYASGGDPEYETSTRYQFPDVRTARGCFETFIGQSVTWPDNGNEWQDDPPFGAEDVI